MKLNLASMHRAIMLGFVLAATADSARAQCANEWSALGTGMNESVYGLAVFDDGDGPALYAGGLFTTAGGGLSIANGAPTTDALLGILQGVAVTSSYAYFSDASDSRVRRVDPTTGIMSTAASSGPFGYSGDGGPQASFRRPELLLSYHFASQKARIRGSRHRPRHGSSCI